MAEPSTSAPPASPGEERESVMQRRLVRLGSAAAAVASVVGLVRPVGVQAAPVPCDGGPIVLPGCTSGGDCTALIGNQCVEVQPPMLPPAPHAGVEIQGGVGI